MTPLIAWFEAIFGGIPLPVLEVWGRFAYAVGLILAICAFGNFTFRIGQHWGFGRARQTWDAKAFLSVPLTFVLIIATGYIGSFIVLVPGAQTFELLKDLAVLLCIVLFGYPALIAVPPAYMLSDLIEGVPPGFVANWAEGYFFWTSFVWLAYQFIGRNPDFRQAQDLVALWRVRRLDHAVRSGHVGVHLLRQVHLGDLVSKYLFGAGVHLVGDMGAGARGLPDCVAARKAVRMVLGGDPRDTSGNALSGAARRTWEAGHGDTSGSADPVQRWTADPGLHLHAVHRAGARNGRHDRDCRASDRGR